MATKPTRQAISVRRRGCGAECQSRPQPWHPTTRTAPDKLPNTGQTYNRSTDAAAQPEKDPPEDLGRRARTLNLPLGKCTCGSRANDLSPSGPLGVGHGTRMPQVGRERQRTSLGELIAGSVPTVWERATHRRNGRSF